MTATGSKWRNVEGWKEAARSFGSGLLQAAGLIVLYLALAVSASWLQGCTSAATTAPRSEDAVVDARRLLDTLWEVEATRQAVLRSADRMLDAGTLTPAAHKAMFTIGVEIFQAWTAASQMFDRYTTTGGVSAEDLREAGKDLRSWIKTMLVVAQSHGITTPTWSDSFDREEEP